MTPRYEARFTGVTRVIEVWGVWDNERELFVIDSCPKAAAEKYAEGLEKIRP